MDAKASHYPNVTSNCDSTRRRSDNIVVFASMAFVTSGRVATNDRFARVSSLVSNAVGWTRTTHGRKLFRYTLVSVASTTTSIVVIAIVYGFRVIPDEVAATIVGNVVATIPSYNLNRKWTWGKSGRVTFAARSFPFGPSR